MPSSLLSSLRVLDLSDHRGQFCGHVLAGLGAEVVLVEPPGGSPARREAPLVDGVSMAFEAFNRSKRSVVADLDDPDDRALVARLAAGADVLVETAGPGGLERYGLDPATLLDANPALVHVSISGFGADGPKAHWEAPDLVVVAAAGPLHLTGDADRAPLRVSLPQAYLQASADAAGAALLALHERQHVSGRGQHVDVSAQQAMTVSSQSFLLSHPLHGAEASRSAGGVRVTGIDAQIQLLWPCADGHVSATVLFGTALGPFTARLMAWVHEEGFCDEAMRDKDWIQYANQLISGEEPVAEYERVKACLGAFFASKTKAELFAGTFERHVLLAPVATTQDVLDRQHFTERGLWEEAPLPTGVTVRHPGRIAVFSATPPAPLGVAPRPDEHGPAIRAEVASVQVGAARRPAVPAGLVPGRTVRRPLEGLKVADFMWVFAGPAMSRVLADHGATVIRVESPSVPDVLRTSGSFKDDVVDGDMALQFSNVNAGKRGITLDLANPAAREVALDLVRWADVALESFTPKAMAGWGLGYEQLRAVNPSLVMLSSCLMGQTGPERLLAGFGTMAAALSGFFSITGWPDGAPVGPFGAYTDYLAPRFGLVALLAALEHRRATGGGQHIDLSQAECSTQLLAPALLATGATGEVGVPAGNDDAEFAPHGVYRARGDDVWLAIAVTSDEMWQRLCELIERTDLCRLDAPARRMCRRELDAVLAAWVATRNAAETAIELQAHRVAAHEVASSASAWRDPQLRERGHWAANLHAKQGRTLVEGPRWTLSRTPPAVEGPAPCLGEHTFEVLTEVLGYDADRIAELAAAEALG